MESATAQDISVGPVRVDTGDDWLDFWFVIALVILATVAAIALKRWGR